MIFEASEKFNKSNTFPSYFCNILRILLRRQIKTKRRKMKKKWIIAGILACIGITAANAQDTKKETEQEPKGKAIVQVFANFHSGFGSTKDDRGFELERSYLGYEYNLGKGLSIKGVMDIGKPSGIDDYQRLAYIKNAQISWKKGNFTLNGGLISTTQFNFQEKMWGYRYVMKSFQDQYKFGNSADLGLSASYKFANWVSADAIIVNGEGYKKIQVNDGLNYGLGFTFTPIKGFNIRIYGGYNERSQASDSDIINLAGYIGYKSDKFMVGAEYNYMFNSKNVAGNDQGGASAYASVKLAKFADLYARCDYYHHDKNENKWDEDLMAMIGAQFKVGKYVKISPNFRLGVPSSNSKDYTYSAYISCFFGL